MLQTTQDRLNPNAPAFDFTHASTRNSRPEPTRGQGSARLIKHTPTPLLDVTETGHAPCQSAAHDDDNHSPSSYHDTCPSVPPPFCGRFSPSTNGSQYGYLDVIDEHIARTTGYSPSIYLPDPIPSVPALTVSHTDYDARSDTSGVVTEDLGLFENHAPFIYLGYIPDGPQAEVAKNDAVSCLGDQLCQLLEL